MLRRTRTIKRILYAPITAIVLVVVLFLLVRAAIGAYRDERASRSQLKNLQQSAAELSNREMFLASEVDRLGSDRGLEEELRNKYPVAKEGEHVVVIVEPKEQDSGSAPQASGDFWSRIFNFFK